MSGLALACPDPEVSTRRRGTKCSDAHHHPEHGSRKSKRRRKLAQDPIFLCSAPEIPGSCMKNEFAIFSPWWVAKKTCRCSHMQVQGLRVEHDARRALASGRPFRPWAQTPFGVVVEQHWDGGGHVRCRVCRRARHGRPATWPAIAEAVNQVESPMAGRSGDARSLPNEAWPCR